MRCLAIAVVMILGATTASAQTGSQENAIVKVVSERSPDNLLIELAVTEKANRKARQEIERVMATRVTVSFKDESFRSALETLAALGKFNLVVDWDDFARTDSDAVKPRVTGEFRDVALVAILKKILEPRSLNWFVRDEVVQLTDNDYEIEAYRTVIYSFADLIDCGFTSETVNSTILNMTTGPWQELDGDGGTIWQFGDNLVIRHRRQIHEEIPMILKRMEEATRSPIVKAAIPLFKNDDLNVYLKMNRKRVTVNFRNMPLDGAIAKLSVQTGLKILLDVALMKDDNISTKHIVNLDVKDVTLRSALDLLLYQAALTFQIQDGRIIAFPTASFCGDETFFPIVYVARDFHVAGFTNWELIELIMNETTGPWQDIDGDGGTVDELLPGVFLINQSFDVHAEIAEILDRARKVSLNSNQVNRSRSSTSELVLRAYDVKLAKNESIDEIAEAIPKFVHPQSWTTKGVISVVKGRILIKQTRSIHVEVIRFLKNLERELQHPTQIFLIGGGFFSIGDRSFPSKRSLHTRANPANTR